jgi:hypothetical protein
MLDFLDQAAGEANRKSFLIKDLRRAGALRVALDHIL